MYMYYLLGYRLFDEEFSKLLSNEDSDEDEEDHQSDTSSRRSSLSSDTDKAKDQKPASDTKEQSKAGNSTFMYYVTSGRFANMDESLIVKASAQIYQAYINSFHFN